MNESHFALFETHYREGLRKAVIEHPDEYRFPLAQVDIVANKMLSALRRNSYNKDGRAFKYACRAVGIKHTYSAIDAYLER